MSDSLSLLLGGCVLLVLYCVLVFLAASRPEKPVFAQLPYIVGVAAAFLLIRHEIVWPLFLIIVLYCVVTWLVILALRHARDGSKASTDSDDQGSL